MKHIDDYIVIFHQKDEEWECIAIIESATKNAIREQIVRLYNLWGYDDNEDAIKEINDVVDGLYTEGYCETDVDKFKIENVPFYQ
jgi:hypothetical protein